MNDTDLVNIFIIFFYFPLIMSLGFKWTFLVLVESLKVVLVQTEIASQWLGNLAEPIRNQLAASDFASSKIRPPQL